MIGVTLRNQTSEGAAIGQMLHRYTTDLVFDVVRLYLMLARRRALGRIAGIGIPAVTAYISLITVIFALLTRAHLSAKEHRNRDQERDAHDQGRRQGLQIGEHARLLPSPGVRYRA
jgi:hypothetical protein